MEYATQGITNLLFAAHYQLYLPNKEERQTLFDLLLLAAIENNPLGLILPIANKVNPCMK